jgi:hypothetical protein
MKIQINKGEFLSISALAHMHRMDRATMTKILRLAQVEPTVTVGKQKLFCRGCAGSSIEWYEDHKERGTLAAVERAALDRD